VQKNEGIVMETSHPLPHPKFRKIVGIISIVGPFFCIVAYILFFASGFPQLWYWPYDYSDPFPLLRLGLIAAFVLAAVFGSLYLYWGIKLLGGKAILATRKTWLRRGARTVFTLGVILTMGGGGVLSYFAAGSVPYWMYNAGPYLTWGTGQDPANSITVCWHTKFLEGSWVRFGPDPTKLNYSAKSDQFGQYHHVPLTNLESNQTYYYIAGNFPMKQFTTAPRGVFNFSVVYWADGRGNNPLSDALKGANMPQAIYNLTSRENTDIAFSLIGGDITARGVDYQTWKLWLEDITTNDWGSNRSHVIAYGNHEHHDDVPSHNIPKYYPHDPAPLPGAFSYSFQYGNTHFIMLDRWDMYDSWWNGNDTAQAEWLAAEIEKFPDVTFRILVMHPPPIYSDSNSPQILQVARNSGIDVILSGHGHAYQTWYMNGSYYSPQSGINVLGGMMMMLGQGGNSLNANYASYCQIDLSADAITLRTRWISGEWRDTFLITK
jgi:hypothetical protein